MPRRAARHAGRAVVANCYLKRVRYGNSGAGRRGSFLFEVVFDYGEHDAEAPTPAGSAPWPVRQDPFSGLCTAPGSRSAPPRLLPSRADVLHHMSELGETPCLVRSARPHVRARPSPHAPSTAATQAGYIRHPHDPGAYSREALPPIAADVQRAGDSPRGEVARPEVCATCRAARWGPGRRWVDLDGEALPGVLIEEGEALYYKQNLSAGAFLSAARPLKSSPGRFRRQLLDIDGDGRKERWCSSGRWRATSTHRRGLGAVPLCSSQPNVDWSDPNVRLIDLQRRRARGHPRSRGPTRSRGIRRSPRAA